MATKTMVPKTAVKQTAKKIVENKVQKQSVKKEKISSYKLQLAWHKANKIEDLSLSAAIKKLLFEDANGVELMKIAGLKPEDITPKFVISNIPNLKGFDLINGELFQTVYIKKVATQKLKRFWSPWNIVCLIRFFAEKKLAS